MTFISNQLIRTHVYQCYLFINMYVNIFRCFLNFISSNNFLPLGVLKKKHYQYLLQLTNIDNAVNIHSYIIYSSLPIAFNAALNTDGNSLGFFIVSNTFSFPKTSCITPHSSFPKLYNLNCLSFPTSLLS